MVEIVFSHADSGHLIWLKESSGPIPDLEGLERATAFNRKIGNTTVGIEQELIKQNSRRKRAEVPPFIQANWTEGGVNFNLRSDGLTLDEAEKVIASMIPEPLL